MARVGVVIANFNGAAVLGACLDALDRQTWRDFRVVLVDNGSTDGSAEAAAARLGAGAVIRNARNLGFAAANNAGIGRALADPAVDYVLTLNSDTVPAPDFLERLVAAADASPSAYGSWQGKVVSTLDARLVDAVGVELTRDSVATQLGHLEIDGARHRSGDVYGVNAAAALYARRFVADVAPDGEFFDADFFAYYEDVDVAARGVGAGWRAAYVADAVVAHVGSVTGGVESSFKWRLTSRNRLFLAAKNYTRRELAATLVPSAAAEARLVLAFARTSRWRTLGAYAAGRASALAGLPRMLVKRRAVLRRRTAAGIFAPPRPSVAPAGDVRLSVLIPTWNGRERLERCLPALRAQTVDGLEVVVVDNGSADGSVAFARERHPEAVVVPLPFNSGFADAVNAGIKACNGEFVALLNDDTVPEPSWAAEMLAAMDHADVAASLLVRRDAPDVVDSAGEQLSRWGVPYRDRRGEPAAGVPADGYPEIFAASGGASVYRRGVLADVGVLDPHYVAYLEDVDLGFRARLAGYRVVLAPRARVLHDVGATASALGHFRLRQFIRNSQLLFWKDFPLPLLVRTLPRFAVIQAHLLGAAARRGALPDALRAHAGIVFAAPLILLKRQRVQRNRRVAVGEIERLLTDHWPMDSHPLERMAALLGRRAR